MTRAKKLWFCRLNVHEDVGDTRICGADRIFYPVRQLVAFVDGNAAIHQHVQIDVIGDSHLADKTFVEIDYPGD